jgi:molybdopterin-containing oxidoreductase family membrane subunit
MKHMKYFIRPEHFNLIGKLMLIVSLTWGYFYFNDYLVPWYGGDKWEKLLQEFTERGPQWYLWLIMLIFNTAVPWLILWNRKWRSTPWLLASVGVIINIAMWLERYVIIPVGLAVNRMPFTWRLYVPAVEIFLTIGTISLFLLLYMLASRLIPLIPVWEVQEGQVAHMLRRVGKAEVSTVSDIE